MHFRLSALAATVLLAACGAAPEAPSSTLSAQLREANANLTVRVEAAAPSFAASDAVQVDVTVTNVGTAPVSLLKWFAPSGDLEEALFVVTRDGVAVPYAGAEYKRPATTEADYLVIAPGGTLTQRVDLGSVYDLSTSGNYTVRFDVASKELHGLGGKDALALRSNEISFYAAGRAFETVKPGSGGGTTVGNITMVSCTATQQTGALNGANAAKSYATGARSYLGGNPAATPRYTTWFGAFNTAGWNTASSHFVSIENAFLTKPVTIDCGCKKNYYAFVYPTQPYIIHVCNAYWTAPTTGTDSKGGTLIHEMSHFNVTAGTDDWVYGQSGAKSLAISDPSKALDNADSHEYFAENTPAQN